VLGDADRTEFLCDMARLGDAILRVTSAERINYEIPRQFRAMTHHRKEDP
jgi:hypothetical protein